MSRALLHVWLAHTCISVLALALTEFHTNGTSGEPCGPGRHHCISTAKCFQSDSLCRCKPPLVGNGKLGCFRPGDGTVYLQLDPYIKTFNGEYLQISTPCSFKVMHYTLVTAGGVHASAEVYAKSTLFKGGEYYITSVLVSISVIKETKVLKHSVLFEGSATNGTYTFITTVLEDTMTQKNRTDFSEFRVSVSTDNVNNFITARITGVHLIVRFRPPPAETENVQKMAPGVLIVIDKEVISSVKFMTGTLSSYPNGSSLKLEADSLGLKVDLYVYFLAMYNRQAIMADDQTCTDTSIVFNNICQNNKTRISLLKTCSSLYNDKQFLSCWYDKHKEGGNDTDYKLLFRYCAQSFCMHRIEICQAMMQRIEATQCPLPSTLRDFTCFSDAIQQQDNL